jgi:hypothetical protein
MPDLRQHARGPRSRSTSTRAVAQRDSGLGRDVECVLDDAYEIAVWRPRRGAGAIPGGRRKCSANRPAQVEAGVSLRSSGSHRVSSNARANLGGLPAVGSDRREASRFRALHPVLPDCAAESVGVRQVPRGGRSYRGGVSRPGGAGQMEAPWATTELTAVVRRAVG